MRIELNIEKKYALMIIAVITLAALGLFAIAQTAPKDLPVWHTLQSIAVNSNGDVSVDANGNGVIDAAEGWRVLAKGSDLTEEAKITITSSGITFETDQEWPEQRVNAGLIEWPVYKPSEIMLVVNNDFDQFCVGGEGKLDLEGDGGAVKANCIDYRYKGTTLTRTPMNNQNDWLRLSINGEKQIYCPDMLDPANRQADATNPGTFGLNAVFSVFCRYPITADLSSLTIEEADWSPNYGAWNWEIWYR